MKKFAFLVHPRNLQDVFRRYPALKLIPNDNLKEDLISFLPPIRLGSVMWQNEPFGQITAIPFTASSIQRKKSKAKKLIRRALQQFAREDIRVVGLGALTSSITESGKDIVDEADAANLVVTTGNALTAAVAVQSLEILSANLNRNLFNGTIGIVGATGSVGTGVSLLLAESSCSNFMLVGKTLQHLQELQDILEKKYNKKSTISTDIRAIKECDVIIAATNAPEAFIRLSDLKQSAVIYDIAQPRNVQPLEQEKRKDILVVDGDLTTIPEIQYTCDLGIQRPHLFACLAETILLAKEGYAGESFVGKASPEKARELWEISKKYGLEIVPFTSFGKPINFSEYATR